MSESNQQVEEQDVISLDFAKVSESVSNKMKAFKEQIKGLSKNELERVLLTIVEHPLEQSKKLRSAVEGAAAQQGIEIAQDKVFMTLEYLESVGDITRHKKLTEVKEDQNGEEK